MAKISNFQKEQFGSYGLAAKEGIKADRLALLIFIFSLSSVIIQSILIFVSWPKLPVQIPLYYSRPWGEAMLASPVGLAILPAISMIAVLFNFSAAIFFIKGNRFLSRILFIFCFLVSLTTLYDTIKIITLLV